MTDHPLLGAVLFAIGAALVGDAHYNANAQSLFLGHIVAFNGALLVSLGCNKLQHLAAKANSTLQTPAYNKRPAR